MELLITVILVAILATYGVYYYTGIMKEGKYNAAKGKLAALGGATARFMLEQAYNSNFCGEDYSIDPIQVSGMTSSCTPGNNQQVGYMYNVFRCGYADKNLGIAEGYNFSFGCPSEHACGTYNSMTVYMTPGEGNAEDDIVAKCVYFNPDTDRVVEIRSGE